MEPCQRPRKVIVTVKDRALDTYNNPFTTSTTAQAVRTFADEINSDPNRSAVALHPDDYDLYIVGYYDEQSGQIQPTPTELVVRGKDLIRKGE